ncbi:hypothetical protein [uncultured Paenibacillus sp.]|uniref:hypothetical protein n=1 Tax=uncultured Paenibacillus sp. TaxID=227322 RepID=UPI0015A799E6|nr:hypothetical protein [uncultured Paenibacillus sp.]
MQAILGKSADGGYSNVKVQLNSAQNRLFSQNILSRMHFYIPRAEKQKNAENQLQFCSWFSACGGGGWFRHGRLVTLLREVAVGSATGRW